MPLNKLKIFNDPIYGFITIPNSLIFDLIQHRYFQRLRRISQMGLSYLVYPGAHHTRFHHTLGSMHLMQKAIRVLKFKGIIFSEEEENALLIAILLHDLGHGPFSHALEYSIVGNVNHEKISLRLMEDLNNTFNNQLDTAISVFKGEYHRKFMCQLISSHIDMDRADYLKRDSFYTGVAEGNINSERLITMLNVVNDELVIEEKGIYSVEKFLIARRFMYWQVYLHKTGLVAEQLLNRVIDRARYLFSIGETLECSDSLKYFISKKHPLSEISEKELIIFSELDDYDVISAIKIWQSNTDFVLSNLCKMILERDLLKIKIKNKPIDNSFLEEKKTILKKKYNLTENEVSYFVFNGEISNTAYNNKKEKIKILLKSGKTKDLLKASDQNNIKTLTKSITKYYMCYPKSIM